ncbi:carbamoyl-phosphate synthase subunit L [Achromobacter marplatensis]|jgi:propionyl-CoA carboxylase alpha chain/3-methylcrotonyl-CoA carboxylase alpha subunit|uniref:Propionyl-CoA carboxylase alpha chain/3-methylcrotonyl-CoA carboxylase alpha subunit n=3 Tax=Achromobacter TaxID=222 RepID=A0ABX9FUR5_9BURK|nr:MULTISPECIES: biotin carboxylase N-terminal domain-containing protein [Achromobacter]OWT55115.1 carbamoyl-phosphate synthase subunit L [Achromobacter marplatensis]PND29815.1 carbamoyl-phosphate synthase subunit L [Achromobacter pulmonis]QYJ20241.1 biotin/lipoyl-binding protein [Achromobacter sp. ES-001]RBP10493.1 propionyl-CoA carboxylase alpha chain/3-methylcrotonyl-CoA carboxylase alpha subunit [Achromobacter marplatensis]CAB3714576.1 Acetyl-/propionyl-coenzyme A carboxylase alpha chain [
MFKRILIANRGEIARRIARTCQRLGIEYVAVHSLADVGAAHLRGAIRTVCLGAGSAADSYLNAGKLLQAARETDCEAVHPGYGFLSENSEFAANVEAAGMAFIGPSPATIAALGDKARAKALMRAAGVPVVPGTDEASDNPATIEALARAIELPILLKPSAGGGGKGMQIITQYDDLPGLIESAIRVARSSFGDGRMIVERYIEEPRHIEVQVFGDGCGNVVHLFERECSLQRRHQKVMEEAPAPHLPERARQRLLEAAVQGARSLDYRNAGTFEFIMDRDYNCYFLEVNTRLQVEHPVTEAVTGLDLVEWQLRVAAGQSLPLAQSEIACHGHAIEARIYAEDPAQDFRPSPGTVVHARWPSALRVDAALDESGDVPPFYDPMVAKIIASAGDRPTAIAALKSGLGQTSLLGVSSNLGYLLRLLDDPGVLNGRVHTRYLDEHKSLQTPCSRPAAAAVCATLPLPVQSMAASPWHAGAACGAMDRVFLDPGAPLGRVRFLLDAEATSVALHAVDGSDVRAGDNPQSWNVSRDASSLGGVVDGWRWDACLAAEGWHLQVAGDHYSVRPVLHEGNASARDASGATAPMSGVIAAVAVQPGDRVAPGDVLAVIEAMKMEYSIVADVDGTVANLRYGPGDSVREGELIADIVQDDAAAIDEGRQIDEPKFQAGSSR